MRLYEWIKEQYPCNGCPLRQECIRNGCDEWRKWFRMSWHRLCKYWKRGDAQ